jgi:hypothetical protein
MDEATEREIRREKIDRLLVELEVDIKYLKENVKSCLGMCKECLIRKIVIGVVSVMGVAVVGAAMALILRSPK